MGTGEKRYVLSIDQSTQGTKALLFDGAGRLLSRRDKPHRQMVDKNGWVEHDLEEIWENTKAAAREVLDQAGAAGKIGAVGISNQRETAAAWDRRTGKPAFHAIVWQCPRGEAACARLQAQGMEDYVKRVTGLELSPYFTAGKLAWLMENAEEVRDLERQGRLCFGTIDAWLLFRMTEGRAFCTDISNGARTQLMDLKGGRWDDRLCSAFGVPLGCLPEICDSDGMFGTTTLDGVLKEPAPICAVLGDSNGALFGQGCLRPGMAKATYGTGSSVMANTGDQALTGVKGLAASAAWRISGRVQYVLEGNINYTGAVISWMQKEMGLISQPKEAEELALSANPEDRTYLVPAFTGLGAPYWDSRATATVTGMSRTTGRAELVRAGLESIAYQVYDVAERMDQALLSMGGEGLHALQADGGASKNRYLMQLQADLLKIPVRVPGKEELSGIGAAFLAGIRAGIYDRERLFDNQASREYLPGMEEKERERRIKGWRQAVARTRYQG